MRSIFMTGLLVFVVMSATAVACGFDSVPRSRNTTEHDVSRTLIVEPCLILPGSSVDPCERRDHWDIGVSASYRLESFPGRPFNTYDEMKRLSALCPNGLCTPQFYIRATIIPGSARCLRTEAAIAQDDQGHIAGAQFYTQRDEYLRWDCFVDATVHEYLNGTGPRRLPINLRTIFLDASKTSPEVIGSYARGVSWDYEGYEFIIPLARNRNLAVGEWSKVPNGLWDVQKTDDGEVIVVSWWHTIAPLEWKADYQMSLADFRDMTREGMERYFRETDGRLGTSGKNPLAAIDASRDGLLGMLTELGAFSVADVTPASAPPAPGENDPYTPGQNILDQTVTASPEVPGGLEGTPTPVSALGDEPTATATVEPTATVTPEPAPTPEQEDTPTPEPEVAPTATPDPAPTPEPEPTATPETVVESTATPEPAPVVEPTATATPEPEPVIEPTATPEDAVATDTPEPEVPGPVGPGAVGEPGDEDGPDGPDTNSGPDG